MLRGDDAVMPTRLEQHAVRSILVSLRSPCIVDLGARCGEEEEWLRAACSEEAHYVMVEPDAWNCQVICDKGLHANRRLVIGCVAQLDGKTRFNTSLSQDGVTRGSGSWREPYLHQRVIPGVNFPPNLATIVPCFTLDTIFEREWLTKIDLLWCDIQGAEREMIQGGQTALSHTRYLFIETEERELYKGMALKPELLTMLADWNLIRYFPDNCLFSNPNFTERGPR